MKGFGGNVMREGVPRRWWPSHRPAQGGKDALVVFPYVRHLGIAWVCLTVPLVTWAATTVDSANDYIFVLIYLACGTYTSPALVVGFYTARRARECAMAFRLLYAGLVVMWIIGVGMLVGVRTGWHWANVLGLPLVALSGGLKITGLAMLVRSRSGRRALTVDVVEAVAAVVALTAPLVVLWGPAVVGAEASWFTVPAALTLVFTVAGIYWTAVLCVRLGPGPRMFGACALALSVAGTVNVALQTAQGVSDFTLPAPPLIFFNALTVSMYFLVPLYSPRLMGPGLGRLPLQAQVRGARLATALPLAGVAALLGATALVAGERPWTVAFALGVVALLCVLAALRQLAAIGETRRLYRQVEVASEERGRLLSQMLERSVHDRRHFARQLHEQAVSAAASFATLAGAGYEPAGGSALVTEASVLVRGELGRHADSLRDLMMAIRPPDGDRRSDERLRTPIAVHFASVYGDGLSPHVRVSVDGDLVLDWVTETVVLQIVHEALHNVWRHSDACEVQVTIEPDAGVVHLRVQDDGEGFDPDAVPEGPGIVSMRASAAVVGGTLTVLSRPGKGTTIDARLGGLWSDPGPHQAPVATPTPQRRFGPAGLRLVTDPRPCG
jgi:signal transduction histidine kinase